MTYTEVVLTAIALFLALLWRSVVSLNADVLNASNHQSQWNDRIWQVLVMVKAAIERLATPGETGKPAAPRKVSVKLADVVGQPLLGEMYRLGVVDIENDTHTEE